MKTVAEVAAYEFLEWLKVAYPQAYKALPINARIALIGHINEAIREEKS